MNKDRKVETATSDIEVYEPVVANLFIFFAVLISILCAFPLLVYSMTDNLAFSYVLMGLTSIVFLFAAVYENKAKKKASVSNAYGILLVLEAILVMTNALAVYYLATIFGFLFGGFVVYKTMSSQYKASFFAGETSAESIDINEKKEETKVNSKEDIVKNNEKQEKILKTKVFKNGKSTKHGKVKKSDLVIKIVAIILLVVFFIAGITLNVLMYRAGYFEDFAFYHGKVYKNIVYGEDPVRNSMDLYIPSNFFNQEKRYAIIFIHGGSGFQGNKEQISGEAKTFAKQGYLTATINYSYITIKNENKTETILNDVTNALNQLKALSDKNGWGISKIALAGYSTGGQISLLYSYTKQDESPFKIAFVASRLGPAVLTYDHLSYKYMDIYASSYLGYNPYVAYAKYKSIYDEKYPDGNKEQPLLKYKEYITKMVSSISPHDNVNILSPPTLFSFATKDQYVNISQAKEFKERLTFCKVEHSYVIFENSTHFLFEDRKQLDKYYAELSRFARKYFK